MQRQRLDFWIFYTVLILIAFGIIMVYSATDAQRKITARSSVQNKLWKIYNIEEIDKICHNTN